MLARLKCGQRLASSMRLVGCIGRADETNRSLPGIRATASCVVAYLVCVAYERCHISRCRWGGLMHRIARNRTIPFSRRVKRPEATGVDCHVAKHSPTRKADLSSAINSSNAYASVLLENSLFNLLLWPVQCVSSWSATA